MAFMAKRVSCNWFSTIVTFVTFGDNDTEEQKKNTNINTPHHRLFNVCYEHVICWNKYVFNVQYPSFSFNVQLLL